MNMSTSITPPQHAAGIRITTPSSSAFPLIQGLIPALLAERSVGPRYTIGRVVSGVIPAFNVRDLSERPYKAGVIPLTHVLDANRQLLVPTDDVVSTR
jgi:hypothetical protein